MLADGLGWFPFRPLQSTAVQLSSLKPMRPALIVLSVSLL
ncbi:hypothetical protein SD78_0312 [Bacillus badius]|nr:hypothetical protein SD78_0312 [Bacillus badius]